MSDQKTKTYHPIATRKNDFKLVPTTRGTEKRIRQVEVRFAGVDPQQRRHLCEIEGWDPAETLPELTAEVRIGTKALKGLLERTKEDDAQLRHDLAQLVDSFHKEVEPVEPIGADEYWLRLAKLLFKGFEKFWEQHEISVDDLDFKAIQEAYDDFF